MDEGTAHLDERVETQLLENVRDLGLTVVMAAHKEELGGSAIKFGDLNAMVL
ncbi:hypothetical protein V2V90_00140 [Agrobacterium leguminum]|uniref:hypothetical protein n=1 Tax=Agrobacterium leguminum TaxID=2792015 RepID=UPI0030D51692